MCVVSVCLRRDWRDREPIGQWPTLNREQVGQLLVNTTLASATQCLYGWSSGSAILFFIFHRANKKENPPIYITNEDGDDVCGRLRNGRERDRKELKAPLTKHSTRWNWPLGRHTPLVAITIEKTQKTTTTNQ